MWPRSKIFRSLLILLGLFMLTQILAFFLIPNEDGKEKIRIEKYDVDLKVNERIIIPKCVKDNELAYSAVNRSTSPVCKRQLIFVACTQLRKKNVPLSISCPHQKNLIDSQQYLGCYRDKADARDLDVTFVKLPETNSPDVCINICRNHGASLAGLQFGVECHCGSNKERRYDRLPESRCNRACPGDKRLQCGGFLSQRIFQTGVTGPIHHFARLVNPDLYEQDERRRIAYLLILNGRGWRQIKRLFKLLYHVNHYYYIHVDKRRNYLHGKIQSLVKRYPNVRLTTWRMSTIWGGTSLLYMILQAFEDLLSMKDWHWDYVINLSESDLPVKTDDFLTAYLTHNVGRNFLKSHGQTTERFLVKQGMNRLFLECDEHLWLVGRREVPRGIMLDGGSDWMALHRAFVNYAVRSNDSLVLGLKDYFQYSLLPVESFFHTLAQNSEYCNTVVDNNLHFTNWIRNKGCQCQQRAVVDWCGCSPTVIRIDDIHKLEGLEPPKRTGPRPIFFARKFDPVVDQEIINNVQESLYGKITHDSVSLLSYWESLYHPTWDAGPRADLSRSFLSGLAGIAAVELAPLSDQCSMARIDWQQPGEGQIYFLRNQMEGVLVRVRMSGADEDTSVWGELLMTKANPVLSRKANAGSKNANLVSRRLVSLQVGSSYDPKENLFRNYANVLGPNTTITVLHQWAGGNEIWVHFLWIDPSSHPALLLRVTIPAGDSHKSSFNLDVDNLPLRAGRWRLEVLDEAGHFVAAVSFLIQPVTFHAGALISNSATARRLNCGPPSGLYSSTPVDATVARPDPLRRARSDRECRLTGEELLLHASRLLAAEWSVREWCVGAQVSDRLNLRNFRQRACRSFDHCEETAWSSLAPDPKSELPPVNGHTGRIVDA